jgi:hypothetical protein
MNLLILFIPNYLNGSNEMLVREQEDKKNLILSNAISIGNWQTRS